VGRSSICTECRKTYRGKPPCLSTGKPCKIVEAGLRIENAGSQSIRWKDIALIGDTAAIEGIESDRGVRLPREYYLPARRGTSQ